MVAFKFSDSTNLAKFDILQVTDWLRTEGENYLETHVKFGDNATRTESLMESHSKFERNFKVKMKTMKFYRHLEILPSSAIGSFLAVIDVIYHS